jgi:hypothetical protein
MTIRGPELASPTPAEVVGTVDVVRRRRRPSGEPPPLPRPLRRSGRFWVVMATLVAAGWVVVFASPAGSALQRVELQLMHEVEALRRDGLTAVALAAHALGSQWTIRVLGWSALLVMLLTRRWRHLLVYLGAAVAIEVVSRPLTLIIQRPRPLGVEILGDWHGFSHPSHPVMVLASVLVVLAYGVATPGVFRRSVEVGGTAAIAVLGGARVYLGADYPTDVAVGAILGVAVPTLLFRLACPESVFPVTYRRGRTAHLALTPERVAAIRAALQDQLGVVVRHVEPFGQAGSAGSTPLRIAVAGDAGTTHLFAKLYAANHLRADRWYKLWRALLYGRLEDEAPFESVRRLVQHEDYVLRVMRDAALPVPEPFGFVEITPEREYLLVTEFLVGARESDAAAMDTGLIDDGLLLVRRLWDAGLAHRDIKPANVMVREGRVVLIDAAFSQVRPSPWRQAVDLANMMMVLALRSDPAIVYERALRLFSPHDIAEAFAATSQATRPSLRKLFRGGEHDLLREFRALAPPHPKIKVQRWSTRRVVLTVRVAAVVLLSLVLLREQLMLAGLL